MTTKPELSPVQLADLTAFGCYVERVFSDGRRERIDPESMQAPNPRSAAKPGRKPLADGALSAAERQRLYRERQKAAKF